MPCGLLGLLGVAVGAALLGTAVALTWLAPHSACGADSSPKRCSPEKHHPKGAAAFVAERLYADPSLLQQNVGGDVAAELPGVSGRAAIKPLIANLPASGDARAQVITLALVLEARTPKDAWRGGHYSRSGEPGAPCYLKFLAANGYTLASVEDIGTGTRSADEVYDDLLREKEAAAT